MYDLISIGTVSMDLYFKGDSLSIKNNHFQLACGGKYFVDFFHEGLGGGATNVAIAVNKAGLKVGLLAKIGENTFKNLLLEKLKLADISVKLCDFEENYNNISTILLDKEGEKTVINYRTPHQHFVENEHVFKQKLKSKAVYIANLPGVSLEERTNIFRIARKNKCMTFLNLGVNDCRRPLLQLTRLIDPVDALIVNKYEFADLIKRSPDLLDLKNKPARLYFRHLTNKVVVITDGKDGSYGYYNDEIYYQKAIKPKKIVDTTGAGDGFTGAFIAEYIKSRNIKTSLKKGAVYSSHKLTHLGAN